MHPVYSVILFTTASGAGYGLLFWLGISVTIGVLPVNKWLNVTILVAALGLITVGLLSSTLHLGHPERAFRAFSQWRSSWLSREGVVAVATYVPATLMGLIWGFGFAVGWLAAMAALAALGAALTVYCTSMIYASLRTIRQWNHPLVPAFYLAAAAATGGLGFNLILAIFGHMPFWSILLELPVFLGALLVKLIYWRRIDQNQGEYTAEMATGLGPLGQVRPLDPPHTMPNFVMREMGFRVGRKHAIKLRRIAITCLFVIPILAIILAIITEVATLLLTLAFLSASIGVIIERWLFFAEAEHVSMLFYGAKRA